MEDGRRGIERAFVPAIGGLVLVALVATWLTAPPGGVPAPEPVAVMSASPGALRVPEARTPSIVRRATPVDETDDSGDRVAAPSGVAAPDAEPVALAAHSDRAPGVSMTRTRASGATGGGIPTNPRTDAGRPAARGRGGPAPASGARHVRQPSTPADRAPSGRLAPDAARAPGDARTAGAPAGQVPVPVVTGGGAAAAALWSGNDDLADFCVCSAESFPFRYRRGLTPTDAATEARPERRGRPVIPTVGEQRVAVLIAYSTYSEKPSRPLDELAWEILDETNPRSFASYWREASFGKMWITGSVHGPYDAGDARYSFDFVKAAVEAAARRGDVNWNDVDRLYILVPPSNGRSPAFRPMAAFGNSWNPAVELPNGRRVTAAVTMIDDRSMGVPEPRAQGPNSGGGRHEFGHTLGWGHQGHLECVDVIDTNDADACTVVNAQHQIGAMSMGHGRTPNGPELDLVGWTSAERVLTLEQPGVYRVALGALSSPEGLHLVKIPRNDQGGFYFLEFRRPVGTFEADLWEHPWSPLRGPLVDLDGVQIHIEGREKRGHGVLGSISLDVQPDDGLPQMRRGLNAGAVFVDPTFGTRIEVTAVDDAYAHLVIDATALPAPTEEAGVDATVVAPGPAFDAYVDGLADPNLTVEALLELLDALLLEQAGE